MIQVWDTLQSPNPPAWPKVAFRGSLAKGPNAPAKTNATNAFAPGILHTGKKFGQLSRFGRVEGIWNGLVHLMSKPMVLEPLLDILDGTGEVGQTWVDSGTNLIEIMFRSCIELTFDRPKPYNFSENWDVFSAHKTGLKDLPNQLGEKVHVLFIGWNCCRFLIANHGFVFQVCLILFTIANDHRISAKYCWWKESCTSW